MNECLYCKEPVKNKYCDTSCQNKHLNGLRANKKYGEIKKFDVCCEKCETTFIIEEREKQFPKKKKYYCSKSCSNSRNWSEEDKKKKVTKNYLGKSSKIKYINCKQCGNTFVCKDIYRFKDKKFCGVKCKNNNMARAGGLKSVQSQNKRSKNEIYFYELCEKKFDNVLSNEQMFNGWDADVIVEDLKVAVMWNGVWHYKKITEKHSVEQVQNRDRLKIKEIKKCGYEPYVIKDMGKYNPKFVEDEFEKFISRGGEVISRRALE